MTIQRVYNYFYNPFFKGKNGQGLTDYVNFDFADPAAAMSVPTPNKNWFSDEMNVSLGGEVSWSGNKTGMLCSASDNNDLQDKIFYHTFSNKADGERLILNDSKTYTAQLRVSSINTPTIVSNFATQFPNLTNVVSNVTLIEIQEESVYEVSVTFTIPPDSGTFVFSNFSIAVQISFSSYDEIIEVSDAMIYQDIYRKNMPFFGRNFLGSNENYFSSNFSKTYDMVWLTGNSTNIANTFATLYRINPLSDSLVLTTYAYSDYNRYNLDDVNFGVNVSPGKFSNYVTLSITKASSMTYPLTVKLMADVSSYGTVSCFYGSSISVPVIDNKRINSQVNISPTLPVKINYTTDSMSGNTLSNIVLTDTMDYDGPAFDGDTSEFFYKRQFVSPKWEGEPYLSYSYFEYEDSLESINTDWTDKSNHEYESGVYNGMLYSKSTVAWNGLISVEDKREASSLTPYYEDGHIRYVEASSMGGPYEIVTHSLFPELKACLGLNEPILGMSFSSGAPLEFSMAYKTKLHVFDPRQEFNFLVHILYNLKATLSSIKHETYNRDISFESRSLTAMSRPQKSSYGYQCEFVLNPNHIPNSEMYYMIESLLFGAGVTNARLLSIDEINQILIDGTI